MGKIKLKFDLPHEMFIIQPNNVQFIAKPGEVYELDENVANSLILQAGWQLVDDSKKAKKGGAE